MGTPKNVNAKEKRGGSSEESAKMLKTIDSLFGEEAVAEQLQESPACDRTERLAWYTFDWSNSVYSTVSISLFIPLFLVNLAETHATCGQRLVSCPTNVTTLALGAMDGTLTQCTQCFPGLGTKLLNFTAGFEAGLTTQDFKDALLSWPGPFTGGVLRDSPISYFIDEVQSISSLPSANSTDPLANPLLEMVPTLSVSFGVIEMNPVSSATSFISFSVIFQLVVFISLGAMADFGPWRKRMLVIWSIIGSIATIAFLALGSHEIWWLGGILTIISNLSFAQNINKTLLFLTTTLGASMVFYNAYLPVLVDAHPEVRKKIKEDALSLIESRSFRDRVQNSMSSKGYAAGYGSGVLLTAACVVINLFASDPGPQLDPKCSVPIAPPSLLQRISIALSGVWWLIFSIFTFVKLRSRPGPALKGESSYLIAGWKTIWRTLKHAKKYSENLKFLLAWFIYSDGFNTISNVGILFGQQDICMGTTELVILALEVPVFAMIGNFFFLAIQKPLKLSNKGMVIVCLTIYSLLCVYGLLGYVPGNPLGLKSMAEMFGFAAIHGLLIGAIQSFSRTFFADITPKAHESEFFALYGITDKGSSWMGPLIVAGIVGATGQIRLALVYCFLAFTLPIVFLLFGINAKRGMKAAGRLATVVEEEGGGDVELEKVKASSASSSSASSSSTVQIRSRPDAEGL